MNQNEQDAIYERFVDRLVNIDIHLDRCVHYLETISATLSILLVLSAFAMLLFLFRGR